MDVNAAKMLGAGLKDTFKEMWERIKHGGDAAKDQRIYYFNMKEIMDNKFGTAKRISFFSLFCSRNNNLTHKLDCIHVHTGLC